MNNNKSNEEWIKKIERPLKDEYKDKGNLYLPDQSAHRFAKKLGKVNTHQLRKLLNEIRASKSLAENDDFNTAQKRLFSLVALSAYNAGRMSNNMDLYVFMKAHVNQKSITCLEDVCVFDELYTSIIAYHKLTKK